jgi:hypothetical protein
VRSVSSVRKNMSHTEGTKLTEEERKNSFI